MAAVYNSAPINEEYVNECDSEGEYVSDSEEEEHLKRIYAEMNYDEPLPTVEPLLKPHNKSTEDALSQFNRVFEQRYGCNLAFRETSLKAAVSAALDARLVEARKPLFVYLHSDTSITANNFASEVLSDNRISALIKEKFVSWGFDCTLCGKLGNVVSWLTQLPAEDIAESLQYTQFNEFPLILVLHKDRGVLKQSVKIGNDEPADAVFAKLEQAVKTFPKSQVWARLP